LYIFIYYAAVQTPIQFTYKTCRVSIVKRNNIEYCIVLHNVMKHEFIYIEMIKASIFGQSILSFQIVVIKSVRLTIFKTTIFTFKFLLILNFEPY